MLSGSLSLTATAVQPSGGGVLALRSVNQGLLQSCIHLDQRAQCCSHARLLYCYCMGGVCISSLLDVPSAKPLSKLAGEAARSVLVLA